MRTTVTWFVIVVALAAALVWGVSAGADDVPARPTDLTVPVDGAWYERLPVDAGQATTAYLDRIPPDMRQRGEAYSDSRLWAFGWRVLTIVAATVFICVSGLAGAMRRVAARMTSALVLVDAAIAAQYFVALYALSLPAQVYADFVRPRRAGLSAQSFGAWLVDDLLNWGVLTLFYLVGVLVIYRFIRRLPKAWPLGALGAYVVLSSLYVVLMPNVIEPLTHDFKPLPESTRKQAIMVLALANGIEHPNVVVSNASAKSRLLNAHVSGVGATTRITINDNALSETSDAMLLAVVAHEIGHFVLSHTAMSIVTDSLVSGAGFLFIAIGTGWMVRRYGRRWQIDGMGDMTSLPVFWGLFVLWGFLSLPASNAISRLYERQADLFALNASRSPHGLAEFMIHDGDTRRIAPTAAEYALFYTHPSAAERVFASMKWRAQMSAVQPGR